MARTNHRPGPAAGTAPGASASVDAAPLCLIRGECVRSAAAIFCLPLLRDVCIIRSEHIFAASMPFTLAFCNGKGGTGKTTVAMLTAFVLHDRGQRVVVDDRDPQGNATAIASEFGLSTAPDDRCDFVIVDTSPDIERPATLRAFRSADLVVLVARPEFFDLVSTIATARCVQRERDPSRPTLVLFNQVRPRTIISREILEAKPSLPFPCLNTLIHQRAGYSRANRYGWRALGPVERAEILQLCIELLTHK